MKPAHLARAVTEATPDLFAGPPEPHPKRKPQPQPKPRRAGLIPRRQLCAAMALYAPPGTKRDPQP